MEATQGGELTLSLAFFEVLLFLSQEFASMPRLGATGSAWRTIRLSAPVVAVREFWVRRPLRTLVKSKGAPSVTVGADRGYCGQRGEFQRVKVQKPGLCGWRPFGSG